MSIIAPLPTIAEEKARERAAIKAAGGEAAYYAQMEANWQATRATHPPLGTYISTEQRRASQEAAANASHEPNEPKCIECEIHRLRKVEGGRRAAATRKARARYAAMTPAQKREQLEMERAGRRLELAQEEAADPKFARAMQSEAQPW